MTTTLSEKFTIRDDFLPVRYDAWRKLAEEGLAGAPFEKKLVTHTYEGFDVQPIYTRADQLGEGDPLGFPGLPPFVRGSRPLGTVVGGWDLRQEYAHPDLSQTNRTILSDLAGGVSSLQLRLDAAACQGFDPDDERADRPIRGHGDGVAAYSADDLDVALANVLLDAIGVALDAGAAFLPAAAALVAVWRRRGVAADQVRGAFNADPLAALSRNGRLPVEPSASLGQMAELAAWTASHYPNVTAVGVDTATYHHAGATAAQDVAFSMATALEYLRAMTAAGMDINAAARQILFRYSVGTHHFLSIAKLRAARRLWSRVVEVCGGSPDAAAMTMHVRTSDRVLTQRDPYVNLLRNTVGAFSAGVAGADIVTSIPFDYMVGLPSDFSRRIARNTLLVLQEEAQLHRVVDPAGGSWFLDKLTEQVAETAWQVFQQIERDGGMLQAIESGSVAGQIDAAFTPRAKDIALRKEGITGVSEFPNVGEEPVEQPPLDLDALHAAAIHRIQSTRRDVDALDGLSDAADRVSAVVAAAEAGATIGQIAEALGFHAQPSQAIAAIEPRIFAAPFEALRDASDAWQARHGRRPAVFLANMGPVSHHTARATYSRNFFEAGGFEVLAGDGYKDADAAAAAFAQSGAKIAVICSSDKLYGDVVPQLAPKLKQAGARTVVLAGHPGDSEDAYRAAGVDRFIFIRCDVLATLQDLLREEGVLPR